MIIAIWDWLFTRKIWTIEKEVNLTNRGLVIGTRYILKDQFGNIRRKDVW